MIRRSGSYVNSLFSKSTPESDRNGSTSRSLLNGDADEKELEEILAAEVVEVAPALDVVDEEDKDKADDDAMEVGASGSDETPGQIRSVGVPSSCVCLSTRTRKPIPVR